MKKRTEKRENCPVCGIKTVFIIDDGDASVAIGTGCEHVYIDGRNTGFIRKSA